MQIKIFRVGLGLTLTSDLQSLEKYGHES